MMKIIYDDEDNLHIHATTHAIKIVSSDGKEYRIWEDPYHIITIGCDGELEIHPRASNTIKVTME